MNIFLIGFMGSGKSTLGKKLARKIGYKFIDIDKEIEIEQGLSINDLFNQKGELFFRQCEHNWLSKFHDEKTVIALGGGTPCFNDNMKLINTLGKSVYLKMNVGFLTNRLIQSKQKRPLIEEYKNDVELLKQKIDNLLNEREIYYNKANVIVDATNFDNTKINNLIEILKLA